MEDSSQGWTQLGPFFLKSGHFFRFSIKGRGGRGSSLGIGKVKKYIVTAYIHLLRGRVQLYSSILGFY